jgi:adenine/guanine/hypoxanthine permease
VLAVPQVLQLSLLPVIFALFMTDFFDTMGTMFAVAQEGKLLDEEGKVPQARRILLVDSLAAVLGSGMGASSVTSYIESGSGVAEGGRTGMTSVLVGFLFLLALPFSPLISVFGGSLPIPDPTGATTLCSSHPLQPPPSLSSGS